MGPLHLPYMISPHPDSLFGTERISAALFRSHLHFSSVFIPLQMAVWQIACNSFSGTPRELWVRSLRIWDERER
jgi:hypothetical protein